MYILDIQCHLAAVLQSLCAIYRCCSHVVLARELVRSARTAPRGLTTTSRMTTSVSRALGVNWSTGCTASTAGPSSTQNVETASRGMYV